MRFGLRIAFRFFLVRHIFAQRPQQHDDNGCRNGSIRDIKNRKRADGDKVHDITEPQTVNEIAERAADDEPDADGQQPTRFALRTIKPNDHSENEKRRERKHKTELRKITARGSRIVTADDAKKIERGKGRPNIEHADILDDQIFGPLVQHQNDYGNNSDDERTRFQAC